MNTAPELVMRDLVDVLIGEELLGVTPGHAGWYRIEVAGGWVAMRLRPATALQPYRYDHGPVWAGRGYAAWPVSPSELLALLLANHTDEFPGGEAAVDALRTAVSHTEATSTQRSRFGSGGPRGLLWGERLAATRDRPFLPTARATVGWTAGERRRYGPMRRTPLRLAWVAVRRTELRHGGGPDSDRLHRFLLTDAELGRLASAMHHAGADPARYQPLPVHPWQLEHVLGKAFAGELADRSVLPLAGELGRFVPTASIRTLATRDPAYHVKLPLGVATLGATRLLPPRYLDNGERAQRTMAEIIGRSEPLRELVAVCDERTWCGWGGDPYADRPGQLAAQLRRYPAGLLTDPELLVVPMAALAAHEWDTLDLDTEPVSLFRELATALSVLGLGFLAYGTLPELHGQNVVVALRRGRCGWTPARLVLRDHDTLRIYPEWMAAANIAEPGYRIKSGVRQSLRLDSGAALVGYLQTLGFQVNLYGIADALARHYGIAEPVLWAQLRAAVTDAMATVELPRAVADVVTRKVLDAREWPSRHVFGPLLRRGAATDVSMPSALGVVPNPLLGGPP